MKTIYLATITLLITTVFSCKKGDSGAASPAGATGLTDTGVVQGYVAVYNQYGMRVYTGLRDIQVSMKGGATLSTDDNGRYEFTGVTTGNYTLSISGVGLAPTMVSNVAFVKDTLYNNISISERPVFNITSITAKHGPSSQYDTVILGCDGDLHARNVIVFASADATVSNTNYKLVYVVPLAYVNPMTGASIGILGTPAADLHGAGINSGDTVYFAAYSYVVDDASAYVDPTTGKTVYTAVGQAQTASAVAP